MTEHRVTESHTRRAERLSWAQCSCGERIEAERDDVLPDVFEPLRVAFTGHRAAANLTSRNVRAGYTHGAPTQPHVRPAVCMGIRRRAT